MLKHFDEVILEHISRVQNFKANEFAHIAFGYKLSKLCFETLFGERDILPRRNAEVMNIDEIQPNEWRRQIGDYLQNLGSSSDRKLKFRSLHCTNMGDELYKRSVEGPLLRCLGEIDAYLALAKIHEGTCGAHQAREKMKWVLRRQGVYWPLMAKDGNDYAKACEQWQRRCRSNKCYKFC